MRQLINTPPTAALATFNRAQNARLIIAISDLLTNATDADGDAVSLVSVSAASANGATISTSSNDVFYLPPAIHGNVADSFKYTVADPYGATSTGTVVVAIQGDYNGPSANMSVMTHNSNGTVTIGFAGIPGLNYLVQATPNLGPPINWTTLSNIMAGTNGLFSFTDTNAASHPVRFYRTATSTQ